jgi:hypothetical protein
MSKQENKQNEVDETEIVYGCTIFIMLILLTLGSVLSVLNY